MTRKIEAPDLLTAIAIGLGVELLKNNTKKDSKGSQLLLDTFAEKHPNFKPKTWETLIDWLRYYNNPQDFERLFVPVLIKLNKAELNIEQELVKLFKTYGEEILNSKEWPTSTDKTDADKLLNHISSLNRFDSGKLLRQFKYVCSSYKAKSDKEPFEEFLKNDPNAQNLVTSLRDCINDIKINVPSEVDKLAGALNLNLIQRPGVAIVNDKVNLQLMRDMDRGLWVLNYEESDALFKCEKRKLEDLLSLNIPAPTAQQINLQELASVEISPSDIDNPGLGNCAFYAFAIGLINIIQEEHLVKKRLQFDTWVQLDESIAKFYQDICQFDLTNTQHTDTKSRELLDPLQRSLREINYNYQLKKLKAECSRYALEPTAADYAEQDKGHAIEDATLPVLDAVLAGLEIAPAKEDASVVKLAELLAAGKFDKDKAALQLAESTITMAKHITTEKTTSAALDNALGKINIKLGILNDKDTAFEKRTGKKPTFVPATKLDRLAYDQAILAVRLAKEVAVQKDNKLKNIEKLMECNSQLQKLKKECSQYSLIDDDRELIDLKNELEKLKAGPSAAAEKSDISLVPQAVALAKQSVILAKKVLAQTKMNNAKQHCYRGVTANSLYIEFISVYYHKNPKDVGYQATALSGSPELQALVDQLDKTKIQPECESLVLVPLFLSLLYGKKWAEKPITIDTVPEANSPIMDCMGNARKELYWGLYEDLNCLAVAFDVDILFSREGRLQYERKDSRRNAIEVNNHGSSGDTGGYHWTTIIKYADDLTTTDGKPVARRGLRSDLAPKKDGNKLLPFSPVGAGNKPEDNRDDPFSTGDEALMQWLASRDDVPGIGDGLSPAGAATTKGSDLGTLPPFHLPATAKDLSKRPGLPTAGASITKRNLGAPVAVPSSPSSTTTSTQQAIADAKKEAEDAKKLCSLMRFVNDAVCSYLDYSDSIWFSLFHRHGQAGRTRARNFLANFKCTTYDAAKENLVTFLKDNNDNGNTYPHSFKTILLKEIISFNKLNKQGRALTNTAKGNEEEQLKALVDISKNFDMCLFSLVREWGIKVSPKAKDHSPRK